MDNQDHTLAANLERVRERISGAADRAGRRAAEITLVAVTKTQPAATIHAALACGLQTFGENYVQEARKKRLELTTSDDIKIEWHLIGHLQSNKAKYSVELFSLIHSVDNYQLAQEIDRRAANVGKTQPILIEVNLTGSASRAGVAPDSALVLAEQVAVLPHVRLDGLMGIAPNVATAAEARPAFRSLHRLWERLPAQSQRVLSMGMSNDFEVAIKEGATLVRIGSALFGSRSVKADAP